MKIMFTLNTTEKKFNTSHDYFCAEIQVGGALIHALCYSNHISLAQHKVQQLNARHVLLEATNQKPNVNQHIQ